MTLRVVLATGNKNKLEEIATVSASFPLEIVSPKDVQAEKGLANPPPVEENGATFRANALLKAEAYSLWSGLPALGDDSGLEVDALGGQPGIYSARYAGEHATDSEKVSKLLGELREVESKTGVVNRLARFRCSLALVIPGKETVFADSALEGEVIDDPRGTHGFGYDPIIYLPSVGATLAEVDFAITCEKGFRGIAVRELWGKVFTRGK